MIWLTFEHFTGVVTERSLHELDSGRCLFTYDVVVTAVVDLPIKTAAGNAVINESTNRSPQRKVSTRGAKAGGPVLPIVNDFLRHAAPQLHVRNRSQTLIRDWGR